MNVPVLMEELFWASNITQRR